MIIPAGYAQVNYKFGGTALPNGAEVVLGVVHGIGASATDTANGAITAWGDTMRGYTSSAVVLESVLAKHGPNDTGPSAEVVASLACTGSGQVDPPQVAFLVSKNTAFGGRHGRGRMYLPCPSEGSIVDGGLVETSAAGVIQGLIDDWYAALIDNDLGPYLLHGDATDPYFIDAFSLSPRCASQRRRNR